MTLKINNHKYFGGIVSHFVHTDLHKYITNRNQMTLQRVRNGLHKIKRDEFSERELKRKII